MGKNVTLKDFVLRMKKYDAYPTPAQWVAIRLNLLAVRNRDEPDSPAKIAYEAMVPFFEVYPTQEEWERIRETNKIALEQIMLAGNKKVG